MRRGLKRRLKPCPGRTPEPGHGTGGADKGLTLLELVIAVAVLTIGTLGALRATDQSRRSLAGAMPRVLAQLVVRNRAEELRLFGAAAGRGLPTRVEMGGQQFTLDVTFATTAAGLSEARIAARASSGEGALLIAILPPPGVDR